MKTDPQNGSRSHPKAMKKRCQKTSRKIIDFGRIWVPERGRCWQILGPMDAISAPVEGQDGSRWHPRTFIGMPLALTGRPLPPRRLQYSENAPQDPQKRLRNNKFAQINLLLRGTILSSKCHKKNVPSFTSAFLNHVCHNKPNAKGRGARMYSGNISRLFSVRILGLSWNYIGNIQG